MTYTINTFDGNFLTNVNPGTVDTNTSLSLLGKNYSGYGQIIASNFVYLLENFAKTSAPTSPLKGQLWYDKNENVLKVCSITGDTNSFERLQVYVGTTAPASARDGDLFYDTDDKQLQIRSSAAWVNASIPGAHGTEMAFVKVTSTTDLTSTNDGGAKTVAVLFIRDPATPASTITADNIVAVFAQETFHFLATEPTGQGQQTLVTAVHGACDTDSNLANNSKVTRGMNINTAYTDATVNNASDSTKLGGQLPAYYLDYANFTNPAAAPFVATNASTLPDADNSYTVGSGAARFANIYATTFTGALAGNATTATSATQLNGQAASYYTNATNLVSGTVPSGRLSGNYTINITGNADTATNSSQIGGVSLGGIVLTTGNQNIGGTKTFDNDVVITGDLTINGTTTTVDTTNLAVEDAIIQLASGNSSASATYIGMQAERGASDAYFVWEESSDRWRATTSADGSTHSDANMQAGTVYALATSAQYADMAERYHADETLSPGTVVQLGGVNEITTANGFCSTSVFGVVSTQPAYKMNSEAGTSNTHPYVTLTGRAPVKVIGKVNKGDRLINSEIPGVAQALPQDFIKHCNDNGDQLTLLWGVIGRALENKENDEVGSIEAFVQVNA
jgi:hypothetical protein|tara:strand:+ start:1318 stop:3189 length:1872 start_codon:yes stop_codon:yes gene_type:complete